MNTNGNPKLGELYCGVLDGDHLINLEPIVDGHDANPFPIGDALDTLKTMCDNYYGCGDDNYTIDVQPWGWTVHTLDGEATTAGARCDVI